MWAAFFVESGRSGDAAQAGGGARGGVDGEIGRDREGLGAHRATHAAGNALDGGGAVGECGAVARGESNLVCATPAVGAGRYVGEGLLSETVLGRASRRERDDRLVQIVAAKLGAEPGLSLREIGAR